MCEIYASDLMEHGGPDAQVLPIGGFSADRNITQPRKSNLADVRVEDGKLLYGFSSNEFTALLILGGFSPTKVSLEGSITGFLGRMHIMNHSPFTQIAVFDPHQSVLSMPVQRARYLHTIPVAQCLDLALGIIRTPQRGTRTAIIFPDIRGDEVWTVSIWNKPSSRKRLRIIGDTLQRMTGKSDLAIFTYQTRTNEDYEYVEAFKAGRPEGRLQVIPSFLGELVLHIAHAIDALQPWALLPVTQLAVQDAMTGVLRPFIVRGSDTVDFLRTKLAALQTPRLPSGWSNVNELIQSLDCVVNIPFVAFQGSAVWAANYYCAMDVVFEAENVAMAHVRRCPAADAASRAFSRALPTYWDLPQDLSIPPELFISQLCLHDEQEPVEVVCPAWALEIYATYLWAWFVDAQITSLDVEGEFQRRVFLG